MDPLEPQPAAATEMERFPDPTKKSKPKPFPNKKNSPKQNRLMLVTTIITMAIRHNQASERTKQEATKCPPTLEAAVLWRQPLP